MIIKWICHHFRCQNLKLKLKVSLKVRNKESFYVIQLPTFLPWFRRLHVGFLCRFTTTLSKQRVQSTDRWRSSGDQARRLKTILYWPGMLPVHKNASTPLRSKSVKMHKKWNDTRGGAVLAPLFSQCVSFLSVCTQHRHSWAIMAAAQSWS